MKILNNLISFCGSTNSYNTGAHKVTDYFDDNNLLTRKIEFDEFDRPIDIKLFDSQGNIIERMQKDYYETPNEKGCIEYFKSKSQEYVRKAYIKFEKGLKHSIDEYKSKTAPEKSYINEFIYNIHGKLIDVITRKV